MVNNGRNSAIKTVFVVQNSVIQTSVAVKTVFMELKAIIQTSEEMKKGQALKEMTNIVILEAFKDCNNTRTLGTPNSIACTIYVKLQGLQH
ncbi:hypothetical protein J5N97_028620 [Dioscorea zingiberensis]|uniref:Uncharacterized protein n=1 Tax=Dioscorea zingiberensis TaxID=325984 RepID=A0A9D5H508_9LILI|nr:hypothetical protein J5N97_028620 [Dioscorea zingiberensis]